MKKKAFGLIGLAVVFFVIIVALLLGLRSDFAVVKKSISEKSMMEERRDLLDERLQNLGKVKKNYDDAIKQQQGVDY